MVKCQYKLFELVMLLVYSVTHMIIVEPGDVILDCCSDTFTYDGEQW
jgi:hypothetical protein